MCSRVYYVYIICVILVPNVFLECKAAKRQFSIHNTINSDHRIIQAMAQSVEFSTTTFLDAYISQTFFLHRAQVVSGYKSNMVYELSRALSAPFFKKISINLTY